MIDLFQKLPLNEYKLKHYGLRQNVDSHYQTYINGITYIISVEIFQRRIKGTFSKVEHDTRNMSFRF